MLSSGGMGSHSWREASTKEVHLEDIQNGAHVIPAFLIYLYTDQLIPDLNPNCLAELCVLADQFLVVRLRQLYVEHNRIRQMVYPFSLDVHSDYSSKYPWEMLFKFTKYQTC